MVATGVVISALDWGRHTSAVRERAYPMPQTHCGSDPECAEKAIQIQAREAATAEGALQVAVFQLALSLAGVFGVGFTIFYAHRAWKAAERSANAAHDTLEDARASALQQAERYAVQLELATRSANAATAQAATADLTLRVSQRAYIALGKFGIGLVRNSKVGDETGDFITLTCRIENVGATTAKNCIVENVYCEMLGNNPPDFTSEIPPGYVGDIFRGAHQDSMALYIPLDCARDSFRQARNTYVQIEVAYRDVFEATRRITRARWGMKVLRDPDTWEAESDVVRYLKLETIGSEAT